LAFQRFGFEFGFPTPPRTQLSRSTDRLQLIAGSQLVLPTYQPAKLANKNPKLGPKREFTFWLLSWLYGSLRPILQLI